MFAQMATMAGGMAVGSAVGHAVGHALTGGSGRGAEVGTVAASEAPAQPQQYTQQQQFEACSTEFQRFLECSRNQSDLSMCQPFNDAYKDCRSRYGL